MAPATPRCRCDPGGAVRLVRVDTGLAEGAFIAITAGLDAAQEVVLSPWPIAGAAGVAIVVSTLAGLYPALRAATLEPLETLRLG